MSKRFGSFWICLTCQPNPELEQKEMMEHMRTVHFIDTSNTRGHRQMMMHLDGSDFFSSQFEWEIGGLKFIQSTCNKRSAKDAMRWE